MAVQPGKCARSLRCMLIVAAICTSCSNGDHDTQLTGPPASVLPPPIETMMPAINGTGTGVPPMMPAMTVAGSNADMGAGMSAPMLDAGMMPDDHAMHHMDDVDAGAAMQHCMLHGTPDPRDDELPNEPLEMTVGFGTRDLLVPQDVLDWMGENEFEAAHDAWHLVRRWDQGCRKSNASASSCASAQRLVDQGLQRSPVQQGAPGDGYAFMVMHRHMITMLKMSFPKHADLFRGFSHVPRTTGDSENPESWHQISWSGDNIKGFDILEHIEDHLDQFPTDDDLGQYIENTYKWTEQQPMTPLNKPGSGLHGALHSQWSVIGSPANLIDQAVDVRNFIFWRLHGWIDDVWERYRKAKGLADDEPALQQALLDQCMEMYRLMPSHRGMTTAPGTGTAGTGAPKPETGFFATNIRPFLDATCSGCHSALGPMAGLTLGGSGVASVDVIAGIVGVKASNGQYDIVSPGNPDKSWMYLKASGKASTVSCTSACDRETMPPSGVALTSAQLDTLRMWIMNGATTE